MMFFSRLFDQVRYLIVPNFVRLIIIYRLVAVSCFFIASIYNANQQKKAKQVFDLYTEIGS